MTPLMMAVKWREWWNTAITAKRRIDMVDILLKANADVNTQENVS